MLSDDCHVYSLEVVVQDVIRAYNFQNGLPTRNLIPITALINAVVNGESRDNRSVFQTCGLLDMKETMQPTHEEKLRRWLESHPGLVVADDKVGLKVKDCADEKLEATFTELILSVDPRNAIMPLTQFMNILQRRFSDGEYDYELFSNCGFLTFKMKMGLPTPMLANRRVKAWIKASDKLGIMGVKKDDARMRDYVVILDETTYGSICTRMQRDIDVRMKANDDFVQRLRELLREKNAWLKLEDLEGTMQMPANGWNGVLKAVVHARHQGQPVAMEKFNDQWYFGVQGGNGELPPDPAPQVPLPF